MDNYSNKALVIISCGKRKVWEKHPSAGPVKAKDAYNSNYFRLCKLYAEKFSGQWLILSGKHGIVEPDSILHGNYNIRLSFSDQFEYRVREQLDSIVPKGFTRIISLCGKDYSDFLDRVFATFGLVIQKPLQGLRIGERQRLLKECIESDEPL